MSRQLRACGRVARISPRTTGPAVPRPDRTSMTRAIRETPQQTAEARMLVVEDDANIVELLSASLRFAGFEVAAATDGQQALRLAREFRPDLMVLDVMMPGIDGFEVVRRLTSEGN